MDYLKWKRRIDVCGMILLLFQPVLLLFLADGMVQYRKENFIPVEIKYPLSEVSGDQAVLVQETAITGVVGIQRLYGLVVNKEGRWKLIDYSKIDVNELYAHERAYEFYDSILQEESIPWQKKKIGMNPVLLERALNMPDVEFRRGSYDWRHTEKHLIWGATDGYLIEHSPNRQCIYYSTGVPVKSDYAPLYIQCKMKELASLGLQAKRENR